MGVIMCLPLFVCFLAVSAVNQFIRIKTPFGKSPSKKEMSLSVTEATMNVLHFMSKWDWTSVMAKSLWWGIIYFVFAVGVSKLTMVALSALAHSLINLPIGLVIVVFYLAGIALFLLPPVPGVPVYVAGGAVIIPALETSVPSLGYFGSLCVVIFIGFCLKMNVRFFVTDQSSFLPPSLCSFPTHLLL